MYNYKIFCQMHVNSFMAWKPASYLNNDIHVIVTTSAMHTGILGIIFQFTDTLKEPQHHIIHLGTRLARISNKQHRFQHRSTASRRKLHTHTQYRCGTTRYLVIQRTVRDDLLLSGAKHGKAFSIDHSDDYKSKHNTLCSKKPTHIFFHISMSDV